MCVCVLPRNSGECFVLLLVETIAEKNMSLSDKQLWQFLKHSLVAEKSQCKALSIDRHLEISSLLLMSAEKNLNTNFCIFEALFLWLCPSS